jgi:hypothetical protein
MLLLRAKLRLSIVNNTLTPNAARTFFTGDVSQSYYLDLLHPKGKNSTIKVKSLRDNISRTFKRVFVGSENSMDDCKQYLFIILVVETIVSDVLLRSECDTGDNTSDINVKDFKSFWNQQGFSVSVEEMNYSDQLLSQSSECVSTEEIQILKNIDKSSLNCTDLEPSSQLVEEVISVAPMFSNASEAFKANTGGEVLRHLLVL